MLLKSTKKCAFHSQSGIDSKKLELKAEGKPALKTHYYHYYNFYPRASAACRSQDRTTPTFLHTKNCHSGGNVASSLRTGVLSVSLSKVCLQTPQK